MSQRIFAREELAVAILALNYCSRIAGFDIIDMFFESSEHNFWKGICVILISRHPVVDLKSVIIIIIIIIACQCNLLTTQQPA
jgi:hypothetical protein